ncbi:MAG TPA: MerR family transcriptional regulator [Gammaproteobacteria bacterium]|nr:MerR family transcriptional regulator [Gammaproteobacteria bacterium]
MNRLLFRTTTIGALSKRTGVKIETIRYYEHIGIMPNPPRTEGGQRIYSESHTKRLTFICRSRELGFSIDEIRSLLKLVDGGEITCGEVLDKTLGHIEDIQKKIADLQRMERVLQEMASKCSGNDVPECPILEALSLGVQAIGDIPT